MPVYRDNTVRTSARVTRNSVRRARCGNAHAGPALRGTAALAYWESNAGSANRSGCAYQRCTSSGPNRGRCGPAGRPSVSFGRDIANQRMIDEVDLAVDRRRAGRRRPDKCRWGLSAPVSMNNRHSMPRAGGGSRNVRGVQPAWISNSTCRAGQAGRARAGRGSHQADQAMVVAIPIDRPPVRVEPTHVGQIGRRHGCSPS